MGVNFADPPLVGVEPSDGHLVVRVFKYCANILGNEPSPGCHALSGGRGYPLVEAIRPA